ncbi:MAG: hypothetical protein J5J00_16225 [Deltaproteobacteria bacterium]|nr:hypothetical protein [Deltaproteobacteria bacterium]
MADQTLKGAIPLTEALTSTEPQPALDQNSIAQSSAAAARVASIIQKTLDPHGGPEAVEGLDPLRRGENRATVHSAADDNRVAEIKAFLLGQPSPIRANLTTPGMLEAHHIQSTELMAPITDMAHGYIKGKLAGLGIKPFESASVADWEINSLLTVPPLAPEADQALRESAKMAADRISQNLQKIGLSREDSAVASVTDTEGLVFKNNALSLAA